MKLTPLAPIALALALVSAGDLHAGTAPANPVHLAERANLSASEDPFATVYIVTSRATYQAGLQTIARYPVWRRDSIGTELVVAQVKAHQLGDVSHFIHEKQRRCGGFFAFDNAVDADRFIRSDASAQSMQTAFVASYVLDNQATVNPWLPQVQEAKLLATMNQLSTAYPNRYYASSHGQTSANWIRDSWVALAAGRTDVTSELFTACSNCGVQPSVILTVQGTDLASEIVVIGGHLDSISNVGSGDFMQAPGADDDASGIASLTEVIRIALASGWKPRRTVKFMGYAAEEVGLRGSTAIAQSFKTQGKNVVGVLQLDMTNYRAGSSVDMQVITDFSNASLLQFMKDIFDAYLVPLGMSRGSYTCGYGCSDHASWTTAGFPAVMMYEGGDFPYLHTTNDTLAQMGNSATPSVALTKLGLAFLGELAKTAGTTPPPSGGGTLSNGVQVTGLTAAAGNSINYTIQVPSGASALNFTMSNGTGNADLYVKFGSAPTDASYDCRPYRPGNNESCAFATPQAGTYYLRLKARSSFNNVRLTGSFAPPGGGGGSTTVYSNSNAIAIPAQGTVNSSIVVSGRTGNGSATTAVSVNITHPRRGDLRIRLVAPDGSLYLLKPSSTTDTAANVVATYTVGLAGEPLNGTWQLRVVDAYAGNAGVLNSWSITF